MINYVLGIDPGATGALALYNCERGCIENIWDMPNNQQTLTTGKKTNKVDVRELNEIFSEITLRYPIEKIIVHIEKVQAFGKQSAPAAFNFGYATAIPYTLAIAYGLKVVLIPPQTWKRQFNLQASEKDEARQLVLGILPNLSDALKRKKDIDRADAVLIAMYKS